MHRVGMLTLSAALLLAAATNCFAQKHPLTIAQLIDIKHPSNPVWSPDSTDA